MTQQEKNELSITIALTAKYYSYSVDRDLISMIISDLEDLEFCAVQSAYKKYRMSPKSTRFPFSGQIREMVQPPVSEDNLAREVISKIIESVSRFGYSNASDARAFIGEAGWSVVKSYGGWQNLCEGMGIFFSAETFSAQSRELLKGRITHGEEIQTKAKGLELKRKNETAMIESSALEENNLMKVLNIPIKSI